MLYLYRFIFGFLNVRFYGDFKEKIFNLAAVNRITLFSTKLCKNGIETNLSIRDFRKLPHILRKSGIRVKILKKKGLPFKVKINQKRLGIIIGFLGFIIFLEYMSGFIWIIDVVGNTSVKTREILAACEEIGIKKGIKTDLIDTKIAREKLLLNIDSLAWASLNIEGCKLTVNVSETDKKEDNTCICNLKARADGIIEKIDVTSGNTLVKIGDTVKKGDVLVSGVFEKITGTEFVHSAGEIIAKTSREITVSGDYKIKTEIETGKVKYKRVIEFFGIKIPLYLGKETEKYNESVICKNAKLFGIKLPISIYEKEFRFKKTVYLTRNEEELEKYLNEEIIKSAEKEGLKEYEIAECVKRKSEKSITLSAIITARENIVYRENILLAQEN